MDETYMVDACRAELREIMKENPNVVILGADFMEIGESLSDDLKGRYFDLGIAEQNLVGCASGMSDNGVIPFVYAVSPFLAYRAYEFIRNDVCFQNRNVKIIGHSMGMDFCTWGPSHHTTEDIGALRALPNLTLLCPATALETRQMIHAALEIDGPVYIRMGRERKREILDEEYVFELGKGVVVREGTDITLMSTGTITYEAAQAARILSEDGISVRLVHFPTIKPLDREIITRSAEKTKKILSVDEHNIIGGIGTAISEVLAESGMGIEFRRMGLNDCFAKGYGKHTELKEMNGIAIEDIVTEARKMVSDAEERND